MLLVGLILVLTTPAAHAQSPNPFYQVDNPDAIRKLQRDELFVDGASATYKIRLPTGELIVFDTSSETIEGDPPGPQTVILKFESVEKAKEWYHSADYQKVVGKRLASTTGFAIISESMRLG